jgi:hypothetical protein
MVGPVGLFLHGRTFSASVYDDDFTAVDKGQQVVSAFKINATPDQICNFHPWLNLGDESSNYNYFHLFSVNVHHAFDNKQTGDLVTMTYRGGSFQVLITQQMIDESSYVVIRLGLSK